VPSRSDRSDVPRSPEHVGSADHLRARLEELERRFEAQGMPFRKSHRPGLTPTVIHDLWDLPMEVPWDVAVWFGWHDGVARSDLEGAYAPFPAGQLWGLAECLEQRRSSLRVLGGPSRDSEVFFLENWVPVFGQAQVWVHFAVQPHGGETPVEFYDMFDRPLTTPCTSSISQFVEECHRMLDDKLWASDPFGHEWELHYDEIPPDRKWLAGL